MQLSDLQSRVRIALTTTIVNEWSLLSGAGGTSRPSERAVAFHLGWYLRPMVEESWDIDCEYNRSGMYLEESVRLVDDEGRRIPDLIVHHRGKLGPEHNLLLLELATDRADLDREATGDFGRARALQARFGYQFAAVLDLRLGARGAEQAVAPHWQWSALDGGPVDAGDVYEKDVLAEIVERAGERPRR
ncbi:hypothetical protein [Pengzhenrongella frigida]|uniref:Uncharacterized protein n=1 Tax=Pengzhenrongella frigida TaxID=1259133 RepID=A0A4Q5N3J7_9MICO|nr:hypothetical protein [Cellulomonas sp. HLT2-17]RYV52725.1 hypothetical protein EUA98_01955 [Cellulomonas sp. HLT2-17]